MLESTTVPVPVSEQQAALDSALASFKAHPTIQVEAQGNTHLGIPSNLESQVELEEEDGSIQAEETEDQQTEATEEVSEETEISSEFASQFKQTFGLEPQEAIETFNSLLAFRDEVRLMAEWNVTPSEYQSRMAQVRELYNSLPEEGRSEFNSVEGAVAIWNHLTKDQPQSRKTPTVKPVAKTSKASVKPPYDFKRSEILRMPEPEYRRNAARIQKAFLAGRIEEDV